MKNALDDKRNSVSGNDLSDSLARWQRCFQITAKLRTPEVESAKALGEREAIL